ncbi:glycoside hydrolase family 25 protein [Streptomyces sp. PTM05]|uniref:Glycoside hydrolase family 25 protein n=1 Tax=Streptantibioticus parmotrematis TaxID=2873249 RepID=A0ABS7QS14_9ACTN|nr:glycoside hydrolase family 25 protein [Streptantibioticus parmotrematis]
MLHGIDVSSYQSSDYSTSGLGFVFVKATESTDYVNPEQSAQASHGRAAGLVVGFYHFLRPGSMTAQASYFVERCVSVQGDVLAADWEDTGVSCADKDAFLREVKRLRPQHRVVLYCNRDFWLDRDTTSYVADGLWIADITTAGSPRVQHPWTFHQYSSSGGVDRDVANFASTTALRAWAAGSGPEPEDDMAQWITGTVAPGDQPTVVLVPHGTAWSALPNRRLHLGLDVVGDRSASASVRVAAHDGSDWRVSTHTVTAASGTVDVDLTDEDEKVSLQTTGTGVSYAIEIW